MHDFIRIVNNVCALHFKRRKAIFKNEISKNKIAKSAKPSVTHCYKSQQQAIVTCQMIHTKFLLTNKNG